jgi:ATP-binding cassette subfamily B multidrug efflux pump
MKPLRSSWQKESALLREMISKYRGLIAAGLLSLIVVDGLEVLPPLLIKRGIDLAESEVSPDLLRQELLQLFLIYMGITILQSLGRYAWRVFLIRASMLSGKDLRERFVQHLFGLSPRFFDRHRIGELMSLATSDVEAVRMAIGPGLLTLADALFFILTLPVAMFFLSPELTLLAFIPLPLIPLYVVYNERKIHQRFKDVQERLAALSSHAQEALGGVRLIKSFGQEAAQTHRFEGLSQEFVEASLRLSRVQATFTPALDFLMSLGIVILLYYGGQRVLGQTLSLGVFVAFHRYIQKLIWPMTALGLAATFYQRAIASSNRLQEVLHETSDVADRNPISSLPVNRRSALEVRNLSFRYPGSENWVIQDLSFQVEPGERVAILGPVGSGKTSLLQLLPRLRPAPEGSIFVDGLELWQWPLMELRKRIGFVSQDLFLFSESVHQNVAFGFLEPHLESEAWIQESASLASIHEEILSLPQGYQTRLGERGMNLSGGQRQRVTLARAIARKPSLLILDDPLAAVDARTEVQILKGLDSIRGQSTVLLAAHRISTVRSADRILVLQGGKLAQWGTHSELLRKAGLYRKFYDQQSAQEELESYLNPRAENEESIPSTSELRV